MTDSERDRLILTLTAWGEARGEGKDGITAVVWSILNRKNAGRWYSKGTLAATCLLPMQYSSWNTSDPNRDRMLETSMTDPAMTLCWAIVDDVLSGNTPDPTDGATHYFAPQSLANPPAWALASSGAQMTVEIGRHRFFKNVA